MNLQGRRPETLIAFECLSTMIDHAEEIFEIKWLLKLHGDVVWFAVGFVFVPLMKPK